MRAWIYDGYPGGSRQEFGNPISLSWRQALCKLGLHSTEGGGYPSATTYRDGESAPHVTIDPWGPARSWRQHYPLTEAAWALRATPLVSTNTMGVLQVEIIGTCDPRNAALAHQYVPGITGEDRAYLVGLLSYLAREAGIPWQAPGLTWAPYPASYGTAAPQRLSPAAWTAYRGLIGHQHVPGNTHGDPGSIPIDQWLAIGAGQTAPTPQEDDMFTDQDRYALNLLLGAAGRTEANTVEIAQKVGAPVDVDEDAIAAKVLAALSPERIAGAIPAGLAAQVADELAKRLGA